MATEVSAKSDCNHHQVRQLLGRWIQRHSYPNEISLSHLDGIQGNQSRSFRLHAHDSTRRITWQYSSWLNVVDVIKVVDVVGIPLESTNSLCIC